jgi:hypothetical protein
LNSEEQALKVIACTGSIDLGPLSEQAFKVIPCTGNHFFEPLSDCASLSTVLSTL